jgi:hypothetical protein
MQTCEEAVEDDPLPEALDALTRAARLRGESILEGPLERIRARESSSHLRLLRATGVPASRRALL